MDDKNQLRNTIAKNLANLRKNKKLTQAELAQKFGYSDKAVSKWETGETLPDIEILYSLCTFYDVSLDFLTHEITEENKNQYITHYNRRIIINNALIESLFITFVWILASIVYVYLSLYNGIDYYLIYVRALPVSFFIGILFIKVWKEKIYSLIITSLFAWSLVIAIYLQLLQYDSQWNIWPLFFLLIPIQIAIILAVFINDSLKIRKK